MRKIIVGTCLALLLATASLTAQGAIFYSNVDYPQQNAVVRSSELVAAGWAFSCPTGEHPPFAMPELLNLDTGKRYEYEYTWTFDHLPRQDVYEVFKGHCPKVHVYEGYHLYVRPAPPPGRYRLRVTWDDNGRVYGETRDITIVR